MIHTDPSRARHDDQTPTSRQTILMVDDDESISGLIAEILTGEGYIVEAVSTGADADAAIERIQPDLVILDIMLPDADGLMLCTRLQQQWPAPVIMLSGSRRESDRILSLRLGADDFIAKPFDTLELVARVQAVLRRAPREIGIPPTSPLAPAASFPSRRDVQAQQATRPARDAESPIEIGELMIDQRRRSVTV